MDGERIMFEVLGNSIEWVFFLCVDIMHLVGFLTNTNYKDINTIIFLILQPALILLFFVLWRLEKRRGKINRNWIFYILKVYRSWIFNNLIFCLHEGVKPYWLLINNSSHNLTPHNSEGLEFTNIKIVI